MYGMRANVAACTAGQGAEERTGGEVVLVSVLLARVCGGVGHTGETTQASRSLHILFCICMRLERKQSLWVTV